jgi:hypothetical protein
MLLMVNTDKKKKNGTNDLESAHDYATVNDEGTWFDKEMTDDDASFFWVMMILFIVAFIVISSTVAESYHYIDYKQYALRKNAYNGVELGKVYDEGRYFMTLDNSMIVFPSTFKRVEFTSQIFAGNGLEFDCEISFFYRLPKNNIGHIYDTFSTNYDSRVITNAKQVTKNVASTFEVNDFLLNRSLIEHAIAIDLEEDLATIVGVEAPKDLFEIINIVFPESIIKISLETAIALQNNEILELQQEVDIIIADTSKFKAEIDAKTEQTLEFSINEATQLIAHSEATAVQLALIVRSDGIYQVTSSLDITDPKEINQITNAFAIMDSNNYTMINNLENTILRL